MTRIGDNIHHTEGYTRENAVANEIIGIDKGPLSIGFCKPHRHICFLFTPPLRNCCGMIFPDISMRFLNRNFFSNLRAKVNNRFYFS